MNIKKLIITGAAAGLLLVSAGGAFASREHHSAPAPLPVTNVSNVGGIDNVSVNVANTGLNYTTGSPANLTLQREDRHGRRDPKDPGVSVTTGAAVALQNTDNEINTVVGCGCATGGNTNVSNSGSVENLSVNVANSGLNRTTGGSLVTGGASAGQDVYNVINTGVGSF